MLTFIKYSEKMPEEFVVQYNKNNFRNYESVYGEKFIGLISSHHDTQAAEKIL